MSSYDEAVTKIFEERLTTFYRKYDASKVGSVKSLLAKYKGNEEKLIRAMVAKYGPEPTPEELDDDDDDDDNAGGGDPAAERQQRPVDEDDGRGAAVGRGRVCGDGAATFANERTAPGHCHSARQLSALGARGRGQVESGAHGVARVEWVREIGPWPSGETASGLDGRRSRPSQERGRDWNDETGRPACEARDDGVDGVRLAVSPGGKGRAHFLFRAGLEGPTILRRRGNVFRRETRRRHSQERVFRRPRVRLLLGDRRQSRTRPLREDDRAGALAARRRAGVRHDPPLLPARRPRRRRRLARLLPAGRPPRQGLGPHRLRCFDARRRLRKASRGRFARGEE
mmetsp:Transcript_4066/g.12648  ORF Transcript_4066/g.12648 Transcript_4066/m.12648 type:complete len:342 (-) Transcript_4066:2955-3980(-)